MGVRSVTIANRELLVNGQPVEVKGVNRHEHHPQTGKANIEQCLIAVSGGSWRGEESTEPGLTEDYSLGSYAVPPGGTYRM